MKCSALQFLAIKSINVLMLVLRSWSHLLNSLSSLLAGIRSAGLCFGFIRLAIQEQNAHHDLVSRIDLKKCAKFKAPIPILKFEVLRARAVSLYVGGFQRSRQEFACYSMI